MVSFTRCLLTLSLAATAVLANGNSSDGPTYEQMAATALELKGADLVPTVIPTELFSLSAALQLTYNETNQTVAELGSVAPVQAVQQAPIWQLNYTGAVASQQVFWSQLFTAMIFDAGYPGDDLNGTVFRHYLANNLTVVDGVLRNMSAPVTKYAAPFPANGTGPHRYVALVFAQSPEFMPPANFTNGVGTGPANFSLTDYVKNSHLGKIVAASYFVVQNGTAVAADLNPKPSPTSAVNPADVTALASSISASIIAQPSLAQLVHQSGAVASHKVSLGAALSVVAAGCALLL